MQDELHDFTLVSIEDETADVKNFIFEYAGSGNFTWQAGQYLDWQLPHADADDRGERRWFSIASAPSDKHIVLSSRFAEDSSTLKKHLLTLKPGDVIQAKGPFGEFTLPEVTGNTVLVAGGIGSTPFRSILRDLVSKDMLDGVQLVYGNRSEENVPFKKEFDALADADPGFAVDYVYSPKQINAEVLDKLCDGLEDTLFMISGLEMMVAAIHKSLLAAGVSEENIMTDDFGGYDYHLEKPIY